MKVTAFVGSARKKHTYNATVNFIKNLQKLGNIDYEIVMLSDYNIEYCRGCITCFEKGEEFCPLKDDMAVLLAKMESSDGVILATPNYSFNLSGQMKVFLDRLAFIFHRPRFFGKTFTSIVAQGIFGADRILSYFNFIGGPLGFNVVKGSSIKSLEPMSEKITRQNERILAKHSKRFYTSLVKKEQANPSIMELIMFRMSRTSIKVMLTEEARDFTYYRDKGWFEADFFYPVKLNPFKKVIGKLLDFIAARSAAS